MLRTPVVVPALLAAACFFPAAADAAWETASVGGVDTRIYTPSTLAKIGDGRGLLVVLHGCSQTADALRDYGNVELAAEEFGWVVAIPNVPNGGVVAGCWDYYGPMHTRTSGHNGAIIGLAEDLAADPAYDIDASQVYLSGFSSGGGQAAVTGCLAPDVFAGIGIVAGPAVGTTINQISAVGTTGTEAAALCQQLSGNSADLQSQLAIAYTDSSDLVVAQGYAEVHAEMYGELFDGGLSAMTESSLDVASLEGAAPAGVGTVYADAMAGRVIWIRTDGNGHNWPAGSGETGGGALTFVSGAGVNFSYLMAEFFTANNLRADGDWNPTDSDGGTDTDSGGSSGDGSGSEGGSASEPDSGASSTSGSGDDGSGDATTAATDSAGATDGEYIEPSGCQCTARDTGGRRFAWILPLLVGLRYRGRCRRGARRRLTQ